jgi:hypothetical protein
MDENKAVLARLNSIDSRLASIERTLSDDHSSAAGPKKTREPSDYKVVDPQWFDSICRTLLTHPKLTDPKFKDFLQTGPKNVARYGQLTSGQWKFFGVIHNHCLGTWPKESGETVKKAPEPRYTNDNIDDIPF